MWLVVYRRALFWALFCLISMQVIYMPLLTASLFSLIADTVKMFVTVSEYLHLQHNIYIKFMNGAN